MDLANDSAMSALVGPGDHQGDMQSVRRPIRSQLEGEISRSSVRQCRLLGVVTQPLEEDEPGTIITRAPFPASVKKNWS